METGIEAGNDGRFEAARYALTVVLTLGLTFIFFRSILPRIPRLFLRGRLRVKRVGLRGVRGIEWRSKGFRRPKSAAFAEDDDSVDDDDDEEDDTLGGLVVKVQHIYLHFHARQAHSSRHRHDRSDSMDARIKGQEDGTSTHASSSSRAWITLRIEGVGVTIPRRDKSNEGGEEARRRTEDRLRQAEDVERRARLAEEERLDFLMQSRPSSPALSASARQSRSVSPMPAFATAMNQAATASAAPSEYAGIQSVGSRMTPLRLANHAVRLVRTNVLPSLWLASINMMRALLYLLTSALPLLTSIIDVEVTRLEMYAMEAEAVVRVQSVNLDLGMALITSDEQAVKTPVSQATRDGRSFARRCSDQIFSVPTRIGSGAKGAASILHEGLPGGRVSLRLTTQGLQIFEATTARRHNQQKPLPSLSKSTSRTPRRPSTSSTGARSPSSDARQSSTEPDWTGFSPASPLSSPPPLKRSRSFASLSSLVSGDGGPSRWTDWALEPRPNANFSPQTGWQRGDEQVWERVIPSSARLLSMPGRSIMKLGLVLSGASGVSSKESVHIGVVLSDATIGADALMKVLGSLEARKATRSGPARSKEGEEGAPLQPSKHIRPQRSQEQALLLEKLGSASFTWPSVTLRMSSKTPFPTLLRENEQEEEETKLPSSVQLQTEVHGISFSIKTSDPTDEMHQRWLGTCGVKGYRLPRNGKAFTDRFRWNPQRQKVRYVEHRRAFNVEAEVASIDMRAGINGEASEMHSELLYLGDLAMRARSTWTPFGLLPSAKESMGAVQRYFQGDPNEQAVILELSMGRLVGDLKMRHATALLAFARARQAERRVRERELGLAREVPDRPSGFLDSLPKFSMGVQLEDLSYRLDASDMDNHGGSWEGRKGRRELSLVLGMPRVNFALHASYADQYIKRGEVERKAAWRSLAKDELEWSLRDDTSKKIRQQCQEGYTHPRLASGEYQAWKESAQAEEASEAQRRHDEGEDLSHSETLTIKEALRRMKELQEWEALQDQPEQRRAFTAKNKWQKFARKKTSLQDTCPYNTRLSFESVCTFDSIEIFWAINGGDVASSRRFSDDIATPTAATRIALSPGLSKHHLIALNLFECSFNGAVPGVQDITTDCVRLDKSKAMLDFRLSLEELDVDMWHPLVLDATRRLAILFQQASSQTAHSQPSDQSAGMDAPPEGAFGDPMAQQRQPRQAILDLLKPDTSAYISIGSIIAHVGSVDERCDQRMTRGVGFEAKRAVVQLACSKSDPRRTLEQVKLGLGARSSLELAEDLRSSSIALATRCGKAAMAKVSLFEIGLFPLLDAEQATAQHILRTRDKRAVPDERKAEPMSPSIIAPAVWEFQKTRPQTTSTKRTAPKFRQQDRTNFIFWMPFSATTVSLVPKTADRSSKVTRRNEELKISTEGTRLLSFKVELLHTYCLLMAFAALRGLLPKKEKAGQAKADQARQRTRKQVDTGERMSRFERLTHHAVLNVDEIHVSIALPNDVNLFLHMRRFECLHSAGSGLVIGFESLMAAVESPEVPTKGLWEEMVRMRDFRVTMEDATKDHPRKFLVSGDGATLRVPFGYTVHPIIDNTVVSIKATKQLLHQFLTGSNNSIIVPVAEAPKHIPIVNVKIRILALEAQDDPFETRLNIIWRAGGDENQARSERDAAFQERTSQMESMGGKTRSSAASTNDSIADSMSTYSDDEAYESSARRAMDSKVSIVQARQRLDAFNASSWIRRYTNARAEQTRREDQNLRKIYGRFPFSRQTELPIKMTHSSKTSPLFRASMTRLEVQVGPTTFPESELRNFIHEQGQGVPKDMDYSLLVPLHLRVAMAECRIDLRDYPLPLFHIPPTNSKSQPDHLPAWQLTSDLCIAEQLGSEQAVRHVTAIVVPAATGRPDVIEYGISIPKMAMPTKFFGSPVIDIYTSYPTRIVWGQSLQPAIHDVIHVIEGITSPPHDPSPRIGFWDKLSLIFHGRVHFRFCGDGELHLYLKGSRDPYHILEHGAGWVKCWRGNVEMKLNFDNEDGEVFQIISNEYLLAIPDLKDYIDRAATGTNDSPENRRSRDSSDQRSSLNPPMGSSHKRYMKEPEFKKVCMKLTNGVRWGSALHLERTCTDENCQQKPKCKGAPFYRECRFWHRKPHWEVRTRTKEYVDTLPADQAGDSYEGWRSHHLHFSISIYSPKAGIRRDDCKPSKQGHEVVNNLYFTPLAWEHFWAWGRLFNSALSLPIRQGKLFPGSMAQSPKFGRHIATIKYRFDISPLFITHVYPQDDKANWARGISTLLGVKSRMSVFHFDLHQRQQEMLKERPEMGETRKVFHKPFYEAEIDLGAIDLRTLAGQFQEPEKQLFPPDEYDDDSHQDQNDVIFGDPSDCKIDDQDLEWYDLSDFVELDWSPPSDGKEPRIRLMQAMTCPRFNYYRRVESQRERRARTKSGSGEKAGRTRGNVDEEGDEGLARLEMSKFGREGTHTCLVGKAPTAQRIQVELAEDRMRFLLAEIQRLETSNGDSTNGAPEAVEGAAAKAEDFKRKVKMISDYIDSVRSIFVGQEDDERGGESGSAYNHFGQPSNGSAKSNWQGLYKEWETFDNRFFAHNPSIFYSNSTRDVLLKYYLSSRKRRAVVHSLSARAVRYIRNLAKFDDLDNVDGRGKKNSPSKDSNGSNPDGNDTITSDDKRSSAGTELLRGLLRDTTQYVMPEEFGAPDNAQPLGAFGQDGMDPSYGISDEYEVQKSNVLVLIKPQIVLRSLVDDKSTMILTATRTRMQNYSVTDTEVEEDSINERVLFRNYFALDGLQAFQPSKHCSFLQRPHRSSGFLHVPLETLIDHKYETKDFDRIVPQTDASMHYDKFNKLRLHDASRPVVADVGSNDATIDHLRHSMDLVRLRCPNFAILANSEHFGAIYNVVTNLLLYRDPAYREHAKKLEMMMFSYDLSDHLSLAAVVQALQIRIRHAKELHIQYQLHLQHLNEQGRFDFLSLKAELKEMIDELNLILEAIKVEDNQSGSDRDKKSALRVEALANDIAWNMMGQEEGELLAKLTIKGASFTWLNKADNSAANTLSITDLNAVNVRPNAVFTEIITKYNKVENHPMKKKGMLLNAMWSLLAPVGGIAIMDHLEVNLHPIRLQLEMKIGRQLEDYIFGSKREREKKDREQRAVELAMQESVNGKPGKASAFKRLTNAIKSGGSGGNGSKDQRRLPHRAQQHGLSPRHTDRARSSKKSLSAKSSLSDVKSSRSGTPQPGSNAEDQHSAESDSDETGQHAIAAKNALEMRQRASRNVTFVYAKLAETIFCLSYKGEKQKSITDLYDLVFRAPRLEYRNRTWAHADLANHLKKDILRAAWSQKSTLLKGVINHRRPHHQAVADNIRAFRDGQSPRKLILGAGASASATGTASIYRLDEQDGEEVEDESASRPDEAGSTTPAFHFSVDPPDQTLSDEDIVDDGEDSGDEAPRESVEEEQALDNGGRSQSSPLKLSKFIAKTLGGGSGAASGGKTSRSGSVATQQSRRSLAANAVADAEERDGSAVESASGSGSGSGSTSPRSVDDDDGSDDLDRGRRYTEARASSSALPSPSMQAASPPKSSRSSRSLRSPPVSPHNPSPGTFENTPSKRGGSGSSSLLGNVKLGPSLSKLHSPWHSRKDSNDLSPHAIPRSSSEVDKAQASPEPEQTK